MKLEKRTIKHPSIKNRDITVVFIDDRLDEHSLSFLVEEARTGGRQGTIAGQETHRTRAYKIKELYIALNEYDLTWDKAEEDDETMPVTVLNALCSPSRSLGTG